MIDTSAGRWARNDQIDRLDADVFDVAVVGAGVVGAGTALDLALRGLTVALIEQADFAAGTSSRSSKLFHGGVRYLPQLRLGLVREGLLEQHVLRRIADYLYQPLDFIIPVYRGVGFADAPTWAKHPRVFPHALRLGLTVYDTLGRRKDGRHRRLSRDEVDREVPALRPEGLRGGFAYGDAATDDARLTVMLTATAVATGRAVAVNWAAATGVARQGGRYRISIDDRMDDGERFLEARAVVAATGAFPPPPGVGSERMIRLVRSNGSHLVLDPAQLDVGDQAVVVPQTEDDRVLFVVPWYGTTLVGTTDTPYSGDLAHPRPPPDEVEYLLRHLRRYFDIGDVTPISAFAGLRALATKKAGATAKASRAHAVREVADGYVQVAGGKLTGYRKIAQQVANVIAKRLGVRTPSRTADQPLVGAGPPIDVASRVEAVGMPSTYAERLYERYGRRATNVLDLAAEDHGLRRPIGDGTYLLAEVVYAARAEGAATIGDVAFRRTHLAWFTADHARGDAPAIADALAAELGWSADRREQELKRFEEELVAEGL